MRASPENTIVGGLFCIYVSGSYSDNLITRNSGTLATSGTNFNISAGNSFGILAVGGPFTNSNPWVNLSF